MKSPCKSNSLESDVKSESQHTLRQNSDLRDSTPSPSLDHNLYIRITPEMKPRRFRNGTSTPLQTIQEGRNVEALNHQAKNESIPKNPFDVKADALYFPSFSPSVFASFSRSAENESNFRWSIEQLSELYPVDIDETSVQDAWMDAEHEVKAQKAIDAFFSQKHIAPSPWGQPAGRSGISHCSSSQDSKFRRIAQDGDHLLLNQNEVSTQTTLSIPPYIDLTDILGKYFTCNDEQEIINSKENSGVEIDILSSSSLRRKLFATEEECPIANGFQIRDGDSDDLKLVKEKTPDIEMFSRHSKRSSDLFSSSPITPRNCSGSINTPSISSPTVSPITSSFRKSESVFRQRLEAESISRIEEIPVESGQDESCKEWMQEDTCQSMMSVVPENSELMEESSGFPPQDNLMSSCPHWHFDKQDTGYLTGSTNLTQSLASSGFASASQSQIAPVSEIGSDCAISKSNGIDFHMVSNADESGVFLFGSKPIMKSRISSLRNCPREPNGSSTPTKSSNAVCNYLL